MTLKQKIRKTIAAFAGNREVLRKELSVMNSPAEVEEAVEAYQEKNLKQILVLILVVVLLAAVAAAADVVSRKDMSEIMRPAAGESAFSVPLRVEAEYNGKRISRDITLKVAAALQTDEERDKALEEFAEALPDRIVKEEAGIRTVTEDLDLPEKDGETGVEIHWTSSCPEIIDEQGKVDVTQLEEDCCIVELTADMRLQNSRRTTEFEVMVINDSSLYASSINKQLDDVIRGMNGSTEGDRVVLPDSTGSGVSLDWKTGAGSAVPMILIVGLGILLFLYNGRYDRAKKAGREYRDAVITDFPNVIDKLVLLLNSGLTVLSALMRLSEEYDNERHAGDPLGRELAEIGRRVRNTNASIIEEWKSFASRMGSADILRFCTILEDNLSKGSELSRKLENESESFMDMRRKSIQQHIRMIDSKMMMPMILMLMSLIMVTISPVITGF